MQKLSRTIPVKQWQLCLMLGLSGFAIGNVLAKITTALGF
jgi:hypothetical protein